MKKVRYLCAVLVGTAILTLFIIDGCKSTQPLESEVLKAKIRRVMEDAWNNGNVDVLDELYDADFVRHFPPIGEYTGLETHKERVKLIRSAYPDHRMFIHDILIDGDRAAIRYMWVGTHSGSGLSLPPTGKRVEVEGCDMYRLVDGKIVDEWSSLEIKRLMYMTARRIRYASSPALSNAAVYFKSGSLYKCKLEPDFVCKKYMGNVDNYMNSVAIVEHPDGSKYLVALMSNVLRKNSAVEHQTLATYFDRILRGEKK